MLQKYRLINRSTNKAVIATEHLEIARKGKNMDIEIDLRERSESKQELKQLVNHNFNLASRFAGTISIDIYRHVKPVLGDLHVVYDEIGDFISQKIEQMPSRFRDSKISLSITNDSNMQV